MLLHCSLKYGQLCVGIIVLVFDCSAPCRSTQRFHVRLQIVDDCIALFRQLSYESLQLDCLLTADVLQGFICFLARSAPFNERLASILKALARQRLYTAGLLEAGFPRLVVSRLVRQPCLLRRFAADCPVCTQRFKAGFDILRCLNTELDSPYGLGVLEGRLTSPNLLPQDTQHSLLDGLVLVKDIERRKRFNLRWRPVKRLLDYVGEKLEQMKEVGRLLSL